MDNLNTEIKEKIIGFLKTRKIGASSSEISKRIGHNRITVTKYLEIMKAHKLVAYEGIGQAKLWHLKSETGKPSILVVDDEKDIVELISLSLSSERFRIEKAFSGIEALEKIQKNTPDLIILDLMMPGMHGYELCRILKENALTQHIPIIILSAKTELSDKAKGFKIGADDYITKPFDPMELEARADALLRKTQKDIDRHPLTKLAGRYGLKEQIIRLAEKGIMPDALCVSFKSKSSFQKRLGLKRWETFLKIFSQMLAKIAEENNAFVAHTMADNFIFVFEKNKEKGKKTAVPADARKTKANKKTAGKKMPKSYHKQENAIILQNAIKEKFSSIIPFFEENGKGKDDKKGSQAKSKEKGNSEKMLKIVFTGYKSIREHYTNSQAKTKEKTKKEKNREHIKKMLSWISSL